MFRSSTQAHSHAIHDPPAEKDRSLSLSLSDCVCAREVVVAVIGWLFVGVCRVRLRKIHHPTTSPRQKEKLCRLWRSCIWQDSVCSLGVFILGVVRSPHVGSTFFWLVDAGRLAGWLADDGDLFSVFDIPIISRRVENK